MHISRSVIGILIVGSLILMAISANYMVGHPFWGNYPLMLLLPFWLSVNFGYLLLKKSNFLSSSRIWLSIITGLILGKAFIYDSPLLFIGFIPLLLLKAELERQTEKTKMSVHWVFAFNAFVIWNIVATYWVANAALIPACVAILLNSFFMTIPWCSSILFERYFPKVQGFSLIFFWIGFEWVHQSWEISWPWLTLGNGFAFYSKWIQWYDCTGTFGGSLWILLVNILFSKVYQNRRFNWVYIPISLLIVLVPIWIGYYKYDRVNLSGNLVEVGIIQPNYEPHFEKFSIDQREQMQRFAALSKKARTANTKYLLWPETSFEYIEIDQFDTDWRIQTMKDLIGPDSEMCLVSGLTTLKTFKEGEHLSDAARENKRGGFPRFYEIQNSAVQISSYSNDIPVYVKSKLVPGVETFPYRKLLPFLKPIVDKLGGSVHGLGKQSERSVFHCNSLSIAPVICYESVYGNYVGDYIRKGAQAIFIMTNDGWWDDSPGHKQHLAFGALRAIEFRRPIARCANTGISCFVDARGDISQALAYGKQGSITGTIAFTNQETFYSKSGDFIAYVCLIFSLIALLFLLTIILQVRFLKSQ